MSLGARISLRDALGSAERVVAALRPACLRVEVAGSARRRSPDVGDLDLVAAPVPDTDLFGDAPAGDVTYSAIDEAERRLEEHGIWQRTGGAAKLRTYALVGGPAEGLAVQLWRVPDAQFAGALMVRTGPASFSKRFVTQRCRGGLLRDDAVFWKQQLWLISRDGAAPGAVWTTEVVKGDDGDLVPAWLRPLATPDEQSLFEAAGISYARPEDRQ